MYLIILPSMYLFIVILIQKGYQIKGSKKSRVEKKDEDKRIESASS